MYCARCCLRWGISDAEPPECIVTQCAKPTSTPIFDRAAELRQRRALQIRNAIDAREAAEKARDLATKNRDEAVVAWDHANARLKALVEKGDRFVIDNVLVTVNQFGGISIEPVTVVSLL